MHPYLTPIVALGPSHLTALVEQMKNLARADPIIEPPSYATTVGEAQARAAANDQQEMLDSGLIRLVVVPGQPPDGVLHIPSNVPLIPITVVLSLDLFTPTPRWNLSLSSPGIQVDEMPPIPIRVEDPLGRAIATCFLGHPLVEIAAEGAYDMVRQFIAEAPSERTDLRPRA